MDGVESAGVEWGHETTNLRSVDFNSFRKTRTIGLAFGHIPTKPCENIEGNRRQITHQWLKQKMNPELPVILANNQTK